jgi:hypothetical protein
MEDSIAIIKHKKKNNLTLNIFSGTDDQDELLNCASSPSSLSSDAEADAEADADEYFDVPIIIEVSITIEWKEYYAVGGSSTISEVNKCTRLNDPPARQKVKFAYYTCCRHRHRHRHCHHHASRPIDGGIINNNSLSIASHHSQDHDIIKLGNISLYRRCSDPMDMMVSSSSSSLTVSSAMPCHDEIRKYPQRITKSTIAHPNTSICCDFNSTANDESKEEESNEQ